MKTLPDILQLISEGRKLDALMHLESDCNKDSKIQYKLTYANLLGELGFIPRARSVFMSILASNPTAWRAYCGLSVIAMDTAQPRLALYYAKESVAISRSHSEALYCLACAHALLEELNAAIEILRGLIESVPAHNKAHFLLAECLLKSGDFFNAWPEYRYRHVIKGGISPLEVPDINKIKHASSINIKAEQGLGDAIFASRFLRLIATEGKHICVQCSPLLLRLFQAAFPDILFITNAADFPIAQCELYMMDLLSLFIRDSSSVDGAPYIKVSPSTRLNQSFDADEVVRVGIVWAGNPSNKNDHNRSIKLSKLINKISVPNIKFFNIQHGRAAQDIYMVKDRIEFSGGGVTNLAIPGTDFLDTAKELTRLDLLITVDTAIAHLAGSLGVPVWLLLGRYPYWIWGLGSGRSEWYDSMNVFRDGALYGWDELLDIMSAELALLAKIWSSKKKSLL